VVLFEGEKPARRVRPRLAEELGRSVVHLAGDLARLVRFVGELSHALALACLHPRKVRWHDVLSIVESAGVNALPIVALTGFLLGLILAFQSAIPMRRFGADLFVTDLVALSLLRELGPLMTSIILAGRSGSAFAAELGTMKVNQELDALTTMGIEPVRFLALPRVMAAVFITPLLALFANLFGLVGAAVVVISLGYPYVTFLKRVMASVDVVDFTGGLLKSVVFGLLVAGIGCLRGLETGSGSRAVGDSTTRAVVSGILLIVLADGLFSVLFYFLGV
jgi:phospholipid/cholesterol/gamma-HCH transport system permease protein